MSIHENENSTKDKDVTVNSRNDTPDKIISIYAPNTMLEKAEVGEDDAAGANNINIDSGNEEEEKVQPVTITSSA